MFRAHMHACLACLAATFMVRAADAQVSIPDDYEPDIVLDIVFLNTVAGQIKDMEFEHNGALDILQIELGFQSYDPDSWAADLAVAFIDPSGNAVHFGGYDMFFPYSNFAGQFPDSWRTDAPGQYTHELNLRAFGLQGNGTWTMRLMNGYSQSQGSQWGGQIDIGDCPGCIVDCNGNGIDDFEDIANGDANDCDANNVPDQCQSDCDNDGTPDACEIDSDGNGTPDDCEYEPGGPIDFELSGPGGQTITIPFANNQPITGVTVTIDAFNSNDFWTWASDLLVVVKAPNGAMFQLGGYDVDYGTSYGRFPSNLNSHMDFPNSTTPPNGTVYSFPLPQRFEGAPGEWELMVANGFIESFDGYWRGTIDVGHNANYIIDCNTNGIEDAEEVRSGDAPDCNGNGIPDSCDIALGADSNNDGVIDVCQLDCGTVIPFTFNDNDASETTITFPFSGSAFDIQCQAKYRNLTLDQTWAGDLLVKLTDPSGRSVQFGGYDLGYANVTTIGDFPSSWNTPANGVYPMTTWNLMSSGLSGEGDWTLQITNGFRESQGAFWSGAFTICEIVPVDVISIVDCNENSIDDAEDIAGGVEDCDANGKPDICDIADGAFDTNGNDRIDACERAEGDLNLDGCINGEDTGLFWVVFGTEDPPYGDLDGDGDVDADDFGILMSNYDKDCVPLG